MKRLIQRRLFERLPDRYKKTHNVVVNNICIIDKTKDKGNFVLAYHSPKNDIALDSILHNGFYTESRNGNKGPGAYFATHSTYPLTWGNGTFLLCKIFKSDHVRVFRSELPPGFELTVTNSKNITPICCIDARLSKKAGGIVDWRTNYWTKYNTLCKICDEQGIRCDCVLPYCSLDDVITDDITFYERLHVCA